MMRWESGEEEEGVRIKPPLSAGQYEAPQREFQRRRALQSRPGLGCRDRDRGRGRLLRRKPLTS